MSFNTENFKGIVENFYTTLKQVPEQIASVKLQPDKWSLKEIVGHLIDSASNNHQRIVRLQLENALSFPAYDTESWVAAGRYTSFGWSELIEFWRLYNTLYIHLIENVDEGCLSNVWNKEGSQPLSLELLINDYFVHLKWHVTQFEERLAEVKGI